MRLFSSPPASSRIIAKVCLEHGSACTRLRCMPSKGLAVYSAGDHQPAVSWPATKDMADFRRMGFREASLLACVPVSSNCDRFTCSGDIGHYRFEGSF